MEKRRRREHNHQCRQQIRRPHLFDFCNIQPQNKCHQATYGNKILYGSGIKIGDHPFSRIKTQGQYQNCGSTIRFMPNPNAIANMAAAKISITAFDIKMVISPVAPSWKAPKIFVPLAQRVTATTR